MDPPKLTPVHARKRTQRHAGRAIKHKQICALGPPHPPSLLGRHRCDSLSSELLAGPNCPFRTTKRGRATHEVQRNLVMGWHIHQLPPHSVSLGPNRPQTPTPEAHSRTSRSKDVRNTGGLSTVPWGTFLLQCTLTGAILAEYRDTGLASLQPHSTMSIAKSANHPAVASPKACQMSTCLTLHRQMFLPRLPHGDTSHTQQ